MANPNNETKEPNITLPPTPTLKQAADEKVAIEKAGIDQFPPGSRLTATEQHEKITAESNRKINLAQHAEIEALKTEKDKADDVDNVLLKTPPVARDLLTGKPMDEPEPGITESAALEQEAGRAALQRRAGPNQLQREQNASRVMKQTQAQRDEEEAETARKKAK